MISERNVFRFDAFIDRPQCRRRAMHVAARNHGDPVAGEAVIAGKDVGRDVHPRDVPEVRFAVDVGPGYADENVS